VRRNESGTHAERAFTKLSRLAGSLQCMIDGVFHISGGLGITFIMSSVRNSTAYFVFITKYIQKCIKLYDIGLGLEQRTDKKVRACPARVAKAGQENIKTVQ
jgi:hypothetical protein